MFRCDGEINRVLWGTTDGDIDRVFGRRWYRHDWMSGRNWFIDRVRRHPWRTFSGWWQYDWMPGSDRDINGVSRIPGRWNIDGVFRRGWRDLDRVLRVNRNVDGVGRRAIWWFDRWLDRDIDRRHYFNRRKYDRVGGFTGFTRKTWGKNDWMF